MGSYHSAYHFYGMHVPDEQWTESHAYGEGERLGEIIKRLGLGSASVGVGWLAAGDYDRDMLFLCIDVKGLSAEVRLGEYRLSPSQIPDTFNWNTALRMVADEAGYEGLLQPGWVTVPDLS